MGNAPTWPPCQRGKVSFELLPMLRGRRGSLRASHLHASGAGAERQHAPTSLVPCPSFLRKRAQTVCPREASPVVGRGGP